MALSKSAAEKLVKLSEELLTIDDKADAEAMRVRGEYRMKMEPLFVERHEALKAIDGFWSGVFASPETPLFNLMNDTVDPKLIRAITDFQVITTFKDGMIVRKVVIILRQNMFAEEGVISREVDADLNTRSINEIKWKQGARQTSSDSLFTFFNEKPTLGEEFVAEALDAFDMVHQDPFLAVEAD